MIVISSQFEAHGGVGGRTSAVEAISLALSAM